MQKGRIAGTRRQRCPNQAFKAGVEVKSGALRPAHAAVSGDCLEVLAVVESFALMSAVTSGERRALLVVRRIGAVAPKK